MTTKKTTYRLGFFMIATFAISSIVRADLPYQTNIPLCKVEKERCHGALVAISKSGSHGIYLVEGRAFNGNVYGELVDMQAKTSVNYVGQGASCSAGEGGCDDGTSVTDAHFETRLGVELAIFGPFDGELDLCGKLQPSTYLLNSEETYRAYPELEAINIKDVKYNGATVSYRTYHFDGELVSKTFDRRIQKVNLGTAKLPMGSLVDVFRIEFIDGKIEYFHGYDFQKLNELPDGVFDFSPVCSKH